MYRKIQGLKVDNTDLACKALTKYVSTDNIYNRENTIASFP